MKLKPNHKSIKCSAPGKLILMGEHAVLHGYPCIVAGIDKYLHVSFVPREDGKILIRSTEMGDFETDIHDIQHIALPQKFLFVLKAVQSVQPEKGFALEIESDFLSTIGFGSSAAVTVATLGALLGESVSQDELFNLAYDIVYTTQGKKGSGVDVAASVYGGVLYYKQGKIIERLENLGTPITAVYAGYKTPTPEVMDVIKTKETQEPEKYERIYAEMGALIEQGWESIKEKNMKRLGELFNQNYALLKDLGVSDETLEDIFKRLTTDENIVGAKISGSGLGDCVIGLGDAQTIGDYETTTVRVAKGIRYATL